MIELTCMGCGTTFLRRRADHNSNIKRGRTLIACSNKCVNLARYKDYDSRIESDCQECGEHFRRKKSSEDKHLYCSRSCAIKANNKKRPPKERICPRCNTNILPKRKRFCEGCKRGGYSQRCDWSVVTLQELKDKYSTSQYHAKLRGMSRSEYARFAKPMTCVICSYDLHVDICHIKDIQDFPMSATLAEVNSIDNLVAMCKNHHWEFDHGYLEW